jgi:hypothetical protein
MWRSGGRNSFTLKIGMREGNADEESKGLTMSSD